MITVSTHALERWFKRSDDPMTDPSEAWDDGIRVAVEQTTLNGDEIRYHSPSDTLLIRRDLAIVTVIDAKCTSPQTRQAVEAVGGGEA